MKKLSKIKLNQLNEVELNERELNRLLGGSNCCICHDRGTSDLAANYNANIAGGVSGLLPADGGGGIGGGAFS
jgi:natural product precursor